MDEAIGLELVGSLEANSDGISLVFANHSVLDIIAYPPVTEKTFKANSDEDIVEELDVSARDSAALRRCDKLINQ